MENKRKTLGELWSSSQLSGANAPYIEQLYEDFLANPETVTTDWQAFFYRLPKANGAQKDISHTAIKNDFRNIPFAASSGVDASHEKKQVRVLQLINAYRFRGHLRANTNPLVASSFKSTSLLPSELNSQDFETLFDTGSLVSVDKAKLKDIIQILEKTYCASIGAEYMHIPNNVEKRWIQKRLEVEHAAPKYSNDIKKRLFEKLNAAEGMEKYLHNKYVGQKRFSLEGAESFICMLDSIIQHSGQLDVKDVVIGMAHRGRLNVLINIMGKKPSEIFSEFEGTASNVSHRSGDVKYHQGFSSNLDTANGTVHVALAFNPSHLEIVGPVVEGSVRARQDRSNDQQGNKTIPIIVHGDAAFAGQGVVMETLNMSQSRGYATKGTVHIVINNQIGFTTSNQRDSRSTYYCTDVAKMVNAPIFHVNGDDPEAVLFVTQCALDYRMHFHKDVVIDLVCYRRHGHNEADEPSVTQPLMYSHIRKMPTTRAVYAKQLIKEGVISSNDEKNMMAAYKERITSGDSVIFDQLQETGSTRQLGKVWKSFLGKEIPETVDTTFPEAEFKSLSAELDQTVASNNLHFSIRKLLDARIKMANSEIPVDWGFAETMAYASLLKEGFNVRLSGQDCGRGTFFHRHAIIHDQVTDEALVPLRQFASSTADFLVINSLLSEEAVLAFEYGYASTAPDTLCIWEAQFGDFANGAQVVVDQFISAGEQKWDRLAGLVMMLPHGYEGQGPEHSSARPERYLQLCAQNNMQVCIPSSASQIFHLLRRQMKMQCRKPLIIMTPKSLLRHKLASSPLGKLVDGEFKNIIGEVDALDENKVKRIVLCSGKVFYDLVEKRRAENRQDVAIIRMEQLYPFPTDLLKMEIDKYPHAKKFIWCQEEPKNQGTWFTSQHHVRSLVTDKGYLEYAGRPFSAAPACGYMSLHLEQLNSLLEDALGTA